MSSEQAVGRIVASSLRQFTVECFHRDRVPPFGALVGVMERRPLIFGFVAEIVTDGVDPSRPVAPHGAADEDLETVWLRNPHLPILLHTTFDAIIVGHERDGKVYHYLPEAPPQIISRITVCDRAEKQRFAESLDFLALLVQGGVRDEVTAAFIRSLGDATPDQHQFLLDAGRALVPMLAGEPERLTALIRSIRPG